jgi:putative FmdB family regulatory protein
MPRRYYICDNCEHTFDVTQKFEDKTLKKCPKCKKLKLYQDLTGMYTFVVQEPKTVGQLADRNTKKMGKYELENRMLKDGIPEQIEKREKKEKVQKLAKMTPEQKTRYVMEGP